MKRWFYLLVTVSFSVSAEVTTDGSLGAVKTFSGQFQIPQTIGTTVGNNLFHSFQQFSVQTGESATFTGDSALKNVISRVTGGNPSVINGLLRSTIGQANFYFINPAGVTFGANAQVDVPAAFHVSTADNLKFADGTSFAASLAASSVLSVAEPTGFGFLANQGAVQIQQSQLAFKPNSSLSVSGNAVVIDSGVITNPAGAVQIYTVGSENAQVDLGNRTATAQAGQTTITDSTVNASGNGGGLLAIRSGTVDINGSTLQVDNSGAMAAGISQGIDIKSNFLTIGHGTVISSDALNAGNAGNVRLNVGKLAMFFDATIQSNASAQGHAGDITVIAKDVLFDGQEGWATGLFSDVLSTATGTKAVAGNIRINSDTVNLVNGGMVSSHTASDGKAGNIDLTAKTVTIDGQGNDTTLSNGLVSRTGLVSNTISTDQPALGNGGSLTVNADTLNLVDGGLIASVTGSLGQGGSITVNAGTVNIGSTINAATAISTTVQKSAQGVAAKAGDITLKANAVNLTTGGVISSTTYSAGDAGQINLEAGQIAITGSSNAIVNTGIFSTTETPATGNAGNINLKADTLSLYRHAAISTETASDGNGGDIAITARQLDINGDGIGAVISSSAVSLDTGVNAKPGKITITGGDMQLLRGGYILSEVATKNNDSHINITADNLLIDGQEVGLQTGIFTTTLYNEGTSPFTWSANDYVANAGSVLINAGQLSLLNAGSISAKTSSGGNAGNIVINAQNILIDGKQGDVGATGIFSDATTDSSGNASTITLKTDQLTVLNGGKISSDTNAQGNAGDVVVNAGTVLLNGGGVNTEISSDALAQSTGQAGTVTVNAGQLNLLNAGTISSSTKGQNHAGNVNITAQTLSVDGKNQNAYTGVFSDAYKGSSGDAGEVLINTGDLNLLNSGVISSSTWDKGHAGDVNIVAKQILIDGQGSRYTTNISSNTQPGSTGHAGSVTLTTDGLTLLNGGQIRSDSLAQGHAGDVNIVAKQVLIDRKANIMDTGLFTDANAKGSAARAGTIHLSADNLTLASGGEISSNTDTSGDAGSVVVNAKQIQINGQGNAAITGIFSDASALASGGNGGLVSVTSDNLTVVNGGIISSNSYSRGDAGTVQVSSGLLNLASNGKISSSTFDQGRAGDVTVKASHIGIDGQASGIFASAAKTSTGQTGYVEVNADKTLSLVNGGALSIQNSGTAINPQAITAGTLIVASPLIFLDKGLITAATSGNVDAGTVIVAASQVLSASNNASITSSTSAAGAAGNVTVIAPTIALNNAAISSEATAQSGGQTSDINVYANQAISLINNAKISMQDDATVPNPAIIQPSYLRVAAPSMDLKNSLITTKATGNVNAGDIGLQFSRWLTLDPSFITTAAYTGNGGRISIQGGQGIYLQDSGFLTSASGLNSNGGNINVSADVLVMNTGVIQANAVGGFGGDINLTLKALISSQNQLVKGGKQVNWQPFVAGFNVIQAASENGVNGEINVTAPQFDISGSISGLNGNTLDLPLIERSPCRGVSRKISSLTRTGKGGVPLSEKQGGFVPFSTQPIDSKKDIDKKSSRSTPAVIETTAAQKSGGCDAAESD